MDIDAVREEQTGTEIQAMPYLSCGLDTFVHRMSVSFWAVRPFGPIPATGSSQ